MLNETISDIALLSIMNKVNLKTQNAEVTMSHHKSTSYNKFQETLQEDEIRDDDNGCRKMNTMLNVEAKNSDAKNIDVTERAYKIAFQVSTNVLASVMAKKQNELKVESIAEGITIDDEDTLLSLGKKRFYHSLQPPRVVMEKGKNLKSHKRTYLEPSIHLPHLKLFDEGMHEKKRFDYEGFERRNKLRKKFGLNPLSPKEFLQLDSHSISLYPPCDQRDSNSQQTSMQSVINISSFTKSGGTCSESCERPRKKRRFHESFPMILYRLLDDLMNHVKHGTEIATYDDVGRAVSILDEDAFEEVMTIYFPRMKSFSTFRLQLKIYGFKELSGLVYNSFTFTHPQFHRDRPLSVVQMIPRTKTTMLNVTVASRIKTMRKQEASN
mmetsp:Transcript_29363/g.44454  ORF Transcript_29363/g.44454 Transcript_29363/m.44454 type:complete len:382 (-) Transcript_29363:65-1210(-)